MYVHVYTNSHVHTYKLCSYTVHMHTCTYANTSQVAQTHLPCSFTVISLLCISPWSVSYKHEYRRLWRSCCTLSITSTSNTFVLFTSECASKVVSRNVIPLWITCVPLMTLHSGSLNVLLWLQRSKSWSLGQSAFLSGCLSSRSTTWATEDNNCMCTQLSQLKSRVSET